ncbi:MAG TPA: tetratricopeptide repeat protein [Verrucomicrobiae bacterium]|nr:tetratricopeptide repeat protein [Verrucomicrobiae bacterium]
MLVSPHATYAQKMAAWKDLRDRGELDHAITELEQAVKTNPADAEYAAALGETYLQKLQTTPDVRDKNVLAMKADQSFDTALNADSSNWEARFWKARALSFWPAEFNKSQEVMQLYSTLIDQQETEPPQPQFAKTYVYLGEQYQKAGYADMAVDMWKRGAALFPSDQNLQAKLAAAK